MTNFTTILTILLHKTGNYIVRMTYLSQLKTINISRESLIENYANLINKYNLHLVTNRACIHKIKSF